MIISKKDAKSQGKREEEAKKKQNEKKDRKYYQTRCEI